MFDEKTMQSDRFHIIHNALHVEKFFYNETIGQKIREELGVENRFVVGHVGRFEEQKNHEFLVDIFNEIAKERGRCSFAAYRGWRVKRTNYCESTGICNRKSGTVFGSQKGHSRLWNAMDVFVFPSLFEGLPLVALEAQASGVCSVMADTIEPQRSKNYRCSNVFAIGS